MISQGDLEHDYVTLMLTTKQIADKHCCSKTTVKRLLKKYDIPPNFSKRDTACSRILSKTLLQRLYIEEGKSCNEIAQATGLSPRTVSVYLTKFNIPKRNGTRLGKKNKAVSKPLQDLSGKTFGDLQVSHYVRGGWLCKCKCGQTKIYGTRRLTHDGIKSCGCRLHRRNGALHHRWRGHGDIPATLYSKCFSHAEERGLDFDVSIEYLWSLFQRQNGACALSAVPLSFAKGKVTASIDRIDSSVGYIEGNVQWVHKDINQMKWNYDQDDFIQWCKLIANNN
jgi:predicted transcriptional regulator